MRLLTEIIRTNGLRTDGRTISRSAVRGIIPNGRMLLMVYSRKNGDYKFPGGGIDDDESHAEALVREVLEECGAAVRSIDRAFGKVIEYYQPIEPQYDVFQMTSFYYVIQADPHLGAQNLDEYEADLGFQPVWVDIDEALRANHTLLHANRPGTPRWTARDTYVLEQLRREQPAGSW